MACCSKRTLVWFFAASALGACGAEFTAKSDVDAGSDGSSGSGNTQGTGTGGASSGAGGSGGGSGGSSGGSGGSGAAQGGVGGSIAGSGQGGTNGASGRGGSGGNAGSSGRGGSGGSAGGSGSGGTGGPGGTFGSGAGSGRDAGPDSTACQPQNTVDSCGPQCAKCVAPNDRTVPTCNGTACGFSCANSDATCSDNSCSRLLWTFDAGTLDGLTSPSGLALAVRTFNGSSALAVDVVQLNQAEITFTLPICLSGTLNLSAKTLSFRVYFAGGPPTSTGEFYVGAGLPDAGTGYISDVYAGTATWVAYSDALSKSTHSSTAKTITIRLGSTGAPFSGTVWFDDFRIQ